MMTASEIRKILISTVSHTGGHLASSLGAVELAIALNEEFDAMNDRIVWDVGHQAYAWKILTGRADEFSTLRQFGGLSGFPNPLESKADAAIAGHAGVAISVAEGLASARDMKGTTEHVVAIIGDASISNGTSFEALNNCATSCSKIIVILNDNEMSISKPTGAFSRYLGRLIASAKYNKFKDAIKSVELSLSWPRLRRIIRRTKAFLKRVLISGAYFEQLGMRYMGPIDGHDISALRTALSIAKREDRSVLLHVVTKKGQGFEPAMKNPTEWHGVGPFEILGDEVSYDAKINSQPNKMSWSNVFGSALIELAKKDNRIIALTAAMKDGTGLKEFAKQYPKRFFDVGISEGHLVSYAGGLASGGMKPVVAIYSTFLQRAIDHIMHDVCIAKLPVVFCVDRAGVVGADGVTHQGVFDIAMLRCLPNITICQPKDAEDLKSLLQEAINRDGPTVIRYPRGTAEEFLPLEIASKEKDVKAVLWATGDFYHKAINLSKRLPIKIAFARYIKPFDFKAIEEQRAQGLKIISLENGSVQGGFGEVIGADLKLGWPDEFIQHGSISELEKYHKLDEESLYEKISEFLSHLEMEKGV